MYIDHKSWFASRSLALLAASVLVAPAVIGCGSGGNSGANMPPVDDSRAQTFNQPYGGYQQPAAPKRGLSTGQKFAILAGAAALYYMYKKNKEKQQAGQLNGQPTYYLSKNGRVYYRDQSGRAHWVTPPPTGIQVPYDEAQQYRDFQGYNNQSYGRDLAGLGIQ
jgi:hypothetical protein